MGVTVTGDVTTVEVTGDTTVTVTESVTSVSVSDSTATLTVQPSETSVAVSGNTTSINVEAESQEVVVNNSTYLGNIGTQTLDGSLSITGHLTHGGDLNDTSSIKHSDFTSAGFMRTDGSGNYTVDGNTYLTSFTELNDLSANVTWADVPDDNITETSVTQHESALSIEESQISDLQSYLTSYTETDPVFSAHASSGITATQISQWDTAYGWGNHADAGYLTSFTEANDLSTSVTWANVPDANITESSITQHQTAINSGVSITESQISDFGTYLTTHQDISGKADLTGATFTGTITAPNVDISTAGSVTTNIATGGDNGNTTDVKVVNIGTGYGDGFFAGHSTTINMGSQASHAKNIFNIGNGTLTGYGENTINLKGNVSASGTITAPNVDISTSGTVATNIATGVNTSSLDTKTVNIGRGFANGGYTTINIGESGTTTSTTNMLGDIVASGQLSLNGETEANRMLTLNSDASGAFVYDQLLSFKAKYSSSGLAEAARIGVIGSSSAPSRMMIGTNQAAFTFFDGFGTRQITSANASTGGYVDNTCNFGGAFARWKLGYFASGTTTSSDRNEKQDIEQLNDAELRVATKCKTLLRKYRRTEAIELKGEKARIHFGIIAQDLQDAFTAEGLDAHRYAMFMEDIWYETEEGGIAYPSLEEVPEDLRDIAVEKNRLGVRYEQLLAFIIATL